MKSPCRYFTNLIKVLFLRIRHPFSFRCGIIQSFQHMNIEISGTGKIKIGSFNQNRGHLHLIAQEGSMCIGNHCFFNTNVSITSLEKIEIGDNCKFGNNVVIVDHDHNFRSDEPEFVSSPIKIGNNVWCGANVTILRGTIIEDNCVIGAGTVVKGIFKPNSIIVGNLGSRVKGTYEI